MPFPAAAHHQAPRGNKFERFFSSKSKGENTWIRLWAKALPSADTKYITRIEHHVITTFAGLEEVLATELQSLGATNIAPGRRFVSCQGDKTFLYRANLELRTAIQVLTQIKQFRANSEQALYDQIRQIDWQPYILPEGKLWIVSNSQSNRHRNTVYLSQIAKDAIVDQFRERTGKRPSVDKNDADLTLHLHISRQNEVSVSLNSSGTGLHRRGYRRSTGGAPLNEVLAAGLLLLAGYEGECPFVDPMCGSGTIVAEAAMIAARRAPGLQRKFGFEKWPDFDPALWASIRQSARERERTPPHPIVGGDEDPVTLRLAKLTLDRTGLLPYVEMQAETFAQLTSPPPVAEENGGLLVTNPPYEIRLKTGNITELYSMIGDTLKQNWQGYTAWIISGSRDGVKSVGLRSSKKIPLMNGPIEVRYCRYDLYGGSKKSKK